MSDPRPSLKPTHKGKPLKKGFQVGPANLPNGTHKRKGAPPPPIFPLPPLNPTQATILTPLSTPSPKNQNLPNPHRPDKKILHQTPGPLPPSLQTPVARIPRPPPGPTSHALRPNRPTSLQLPHHPLKPLQPILETLPPPQTPPLQTPTLQDGSTSRRTPGLGERSEEKSY